VLVRMICGLQQLPSVIPSQLYLMIVTFSQLVAGFLIMVNLSESL
jgi:hypothetical protein